MSWQGVPSARRAGSEPKAAALPVEPSITEWLSTMPPPMKEPTKK